MIFTFYSYKGGVGRSMALANIAELFYRAGYSVLMVDWDLEAPGLERFFPVDMSTAVARRGVIDLLLDFKSQMSQELPNVENGPDNAPLPFTPPADVILDIYPDENKPGKLRTPTNTAGQAATVYPNENRPGKLWLLTAGCRSPEKFAAYANAVTTFDWRDFYLNWEGELYFEWLRQQFTNLADIVLVDSRTGVTEIGGVCTYQLADVVVMLCAANEQNLAGTSELARNFTATEVQAIRHDRPLNVLIVPSRIERAEGGLLDQFNVRFIEQFQEVATQLPGMDARKLWQLAIPYVPKYAYTESVAVRESDRASAEDMVKAYTAIYQTLSDIIHRELARQVELLPGTTLRDRYHILSPLAKGGMGKVYQAEIVETGTAVAIKTVPIPSAQTREHFEQLGKFMTGLQHPNIVKTLDYFYTNGRSACIVMEFVDGSDLREIIARYSTLPEALVVNWGLQLCDALEYLHRASPAITHRDIKPSNIKIRPDETAVLVDFGIAAILEPDQPGAIPAGVTPGFSPPEQHAGEPVDPRSDIYALGATLYTLLIGAPPPPAPELLADPVGLRPLRELNPRLNDKLDHVILRAMSLKRTDRYHTVSDFRASLEKCLDQAMVKSATLSAAAEEQPNSYLWLIEDGRRSQLYPLKKKVCVIGRDASADISLFTTKAAHLISRLHATIIHREGKVFLEDLNSSNGTFVNNHRLPPRQQVELSPGDHITLGDCTLEFVSAASEQLTGFVEEITKVG